MGELNRGNVIAALSGLVLLLVMFLSWFDLSSVGGRDFSAAAYRAGLDTTENAWQAFQFTDVILFLTALAAIGAAVISAGGSSGRAPIPPEPVALGLGVLSTLLVLYRILNPILDAGRQLGLFLGFLASAGVAAGSWMAIREAVAAPREPRRRPSRRV